VAFLWLLLQVFLHFVRAIRHRARRCGDWRSDEVGSFWVAGVPFGDRFSKNTSRKCAHPGISAMEAASFRVVQEPRSRETHTTAIPATWPHARPRIQADIVGFVNG
jgi:hypothetical protein